MSSLSSPVTWLIGLLLVVLVAVGPLAAAQNRGGPVNIVVDAGKTYQTIEGFGTCLISWGRYPGQTYTEDFARFYRETVGLNMLRESLNGFTHPEVADPSDIRWQRIEPGQPFVRFAKMLKALDPDIRIVGTVWSPPAWMKVNRLDNNGTGNGGVNRAIRASAYITKNGPSTNRVDPAKYDHFVQWLVAVAAFHREQGIPLYGLSLANEPRFSQWYGSCVWTAKDYATVLAKLGPALESAGLGDILLFGPEDMTGHLHAEGTQGMVEAITSKPAALQAIDRFATHGYTDGVQMDASEDSSRKFWELIADTGKPYWMTEGGTGQHTWPTPIRNGLGTALHNSLVAGNASAFLPWQISEGEPNVHAIAVHDQVTPKTAAGMHYFRNIPADAQRIDATPAFGPVLASAYRHPQTGQSAIVLINATDRPQPVQLRLRGLDDVPTYRVRRTSASETYADVGALEPERGMIQLVLPGASIMSLSGAPGGE